MKRLSVFLVLLSMCACGGSTGETSEIAVMSFNVRLGSADDGQNSWENRKEAAVRMIDATSPDLIGLQEALIGQNQYLAENLPRYRMIGVGRDDGDEAGEFMTIMYNHEHYDLLDSGNFWLSETPDKVSRGWDGACNRMVTWAELREKTSDKTVWFFNTHLDHRGAEARREGAKLLVKKIGEMTGKGATVFLTGDFNAGEQDEIMQPMFSQMGSARDSAPETDKLGTFNGFGSAPNSIILDYIFYRNASPKTFRTVTESYGVPYVSDHYPVMARFNY